MRLFNKRYDFRMLFPSYRKLKEDYDKLDKRFTSVSGAVGREYRLKLNNTRIKGLLRVFIDNDIKVYIKENKKYKETDILEKIYEIVESES